MRWWEEGRCWAWEDLRRAAYLLAAASLLAILINQLRPHPLAWHPLPANPQMVSPEQMISLEQMGAHFQKGDAWFVDARSEEEFSRGHVAGAYHLATEDCPERLAELARQLPPEGLIIIYCRNPQCSSAGQLLHCMEKNGFATSRLRLLPAGWDILKQHPEWTGGR